MTTLSLRTGATEGTVDLEGGRLASLKVHGHELLVTEGTKPSRYGSFPMTPWCGRLAHGRLTFGGTTHELPLTSPPHANHGRGYLQTWTEVGPGVIRTDLGPPWPFGGHVIQRFELGETSLTTTLEVHADAEPMPAMAGWHPWFRRQLDVGEPARLTFAATSIYETDEHQIPTGRLLPAPAPPWDECFVDVTEGPAITWPGALRLAFGSTFDHWVVFTQPDHALCVEPQSGPPNQVNRDPLLARPGEPLVGKMTWTWSPA